MPRFPRSVFEELAANNPPDYLATVYSKAMPDGEYLVFTNEAYLWLIDRYSPEKSEAAKQFLPPASAAIPRSDWPLWVTVLSKMRAKDDRGAGDTIARVVGPIGGEAFKKWHEKTFGQSCGCSERQESLNERYPWAR